MWTFFSGDSHLPLSFKKLLKALRKLFNLITRTFYSSQRSFIKVRFMLKTLRLADYPASANTALSRPQRSKARGSALIGSLPQLSWSEVAGGTWFVLSWSCNEHNVLARNSAIRLHSNYAWRARSELYSNHAVPPLPPISSPHLPPLLTFWHLALSRK